MKKVISMMLIVLMVFTYMPLADAATYNAKAGSTMNYKVIVKWVGPYGRPGGDMIMLMKNGADPIVKQTPDSKTQDTWTYNFNNVPVYDQNGKKIEYSVYQEIDSRGSGVTYRNYVTDYSSSQCIVYNVPLMPYTITTEFEDPGAFPPDRIPYNYKVGNSLVFGPDRDKSLPYANERELFLGPGSGGFYGDWDTENYLPVYDHRGNSIDYSFVVQDTDEFSYEVTKRTDKRGFNIKIKSKRSTAERIDKIELKMKKPMGYYDVYNNVDNNGLDYMVIREKVTRAGSETPLSSDDMYVENENYDFYITLKPVYGKYFGYNAVNKITVNGKEYTPRWTKEDEDIHMSFTVKAEPPVGRAECGIDVMLMTMEYGQYEYYQTYGVTADIGTVPDERKLMEFDGFTFATLTYDEKVRANGKTCMEARYTRNTYELNWDLGEGSCDGPYTAGTVFYDSEIKAPSPYRKGYQFTGWTPEFRGKMPAQDVTYTANWEKNKPIEKGSFTFPEPVVGEAPGEVSTTDTNYTIKVEWPFGKIDEYKANTIPPLHFLLTPAKGYEFTKDTEMTMNGRKVEISRITENGEAIIGEVFPELKEVPIGEVTLNDDYTKVGENSYQINDEGKTITPSPIVKGSNGKLLKEGRDYSVFYNPTEISGPGRYVIGIRCFGNYTGYVELKLEVLADPADYSKVNAALAKIPENLSVYTEESAAKVKAAKEAVVKNLDISKQKEVDKMAADIEAAVKGLKLKPADYSKVNAALNTIPEDLSDYTAESVGKVKAAEKAVVRNLDITKQKEVDKMAADIEAAVKGLKLKPADYSKVDAALAKIPGNLDVYTEESVSVLKEAEDAVVRGLDITHQQEVDKMAADIETAAGQLEPVEGVFPLGEVSLNHMFTKVNDTTYKYVANGKHINAKPVVKGFGGEILDDSFYTVTYSDETRKLPGKYTITVKGTGTCVGTAELTLIITPAPVTNVKVRHCSYSGGYDDAYVTWNSSAGATGYNVYYRRPSKSSKWTYIDQTEKTSFIKKNLYDGYKYEFKVIPFFKDDTVKYRTTEGVKVVSMTTLKKVSLSSVGRYNSSKVNVKWKNIYGESGYQISRSTSKTGTNVVYTYKTTSGTSKAISATANKTYYYKVRAYKYIEKNGKTSKVYGPWSEVKSYKLR